MRRPSKARELFAAAVSTQDSTGTKRFPRSLAGLLPGAAFEAALNAAELSESCRRNRAAAEDPLPCGSTRPADRLQAQTARSQATLTCIRVAGELRTAHGTLANAIGLDANRPRTAPAGRGDGAARFRSQRRSTDCRGANADRTSPPPRRSYVPPGIGGCHEGRAPAEHFARRDAELAGQRRPDDERIQHRGPVSIPLFSGFSQTYKVRTAEARPTCALPATGCSCRSPLTSGAPTRACRQPNRCARRPTCSPVPSGRSASPLGRYRAGVGNILDLLSAQSALAAARQQRVQSVLTGMSRAPRWRNRSACSIRPSCRHSPANGPPPLGESPDHEAFLT